MLDSVGDEEKRFGDGRVPNGWGFDIDGDRYGKDFGTGEPRVNHCMTEGLYRVVIGN